MNEGIVEKKLFSEQGEPVRKAGVGALGSDAGKSCWSC